MKTHGSAEVPGLEPKQLIVISAVRPTRNRGKMPRISAVLIWLVHALARTNTGLLWSRQGVFGAFPVTSSRVPYTE